MSQSSGGRVKTWISELHSRVTDSVDLSCRLKVCVLYKFHLMLKLLIQGPHIENRCFKEITPIYIFY